jgi:hypothetical protein
VVFRMRIESHVVIDVTIQNENLTNKGRIRDKFVCKS